MSPPVAAQVRPPLRVAALQLPARSGDVQGQLSRVERLLRQGPAVDLVLLPEAALTGYFSPLTGYDLTGFAEPLDGPTTRALSALAQAHHTHLVGPLIEREGEACFNAVVGFAPDGARFLHYRKRHPWYVETWATPGAAPTPVVTVAGRRCAVGICFDVHFLGDESARALESAELLLFPSAWVEDEAGADTRLALLEGLAARFRLAVLNANWAPGDVLRPGQGGSLVLGADSSVLTRAGLAEARIDAALPERPAPDSGPSPGVPPRRTR